MNDTTRDFVVMKVSMLTVDPCTGLPAVLLEAQSGDHTVAPLSISIGAGDAPAIAAELDGIEFERPCTHQLMCGLLADAGARVERVEIYGAVQGHYRVRIHLLLAGDIRVAREGRPSDALALALHTGAPIEVATSVLGRAVTGGWMAGWPDSSAPTDDPDLIGDEESRDGHRGDLELDEVRLDHLEDELFELIDEFEHELVCEFEEQFFEPEPELTFSFATDRDLEPDAMEPRTSHPTPVVIASVGGPTLADLADVSDEAFGKWKM